MLPLNQLVDHGVADEMTQVAEIKLLILVKMDLFSGLVALKSTQYQLVGELTIQLSQVGMLLLTDQWSQVLLTLQIQVHHSLSM